jgi:hypothetical protein
VTCRSWLASLVETAYEVKLWDKVQALELAAAYLGLPKKQVEQLGRDRFGKAAVSRQAARQAT